MLTSFWFLLAGLASVLADPAADAPVIPISKYAGKVKAGSYIIKLKPGASKQNHLAILSKTPNSHITHTYDQGFEGYAAQLSPTFLAYVQRSSDVEAIFEDGIVQIETEAAKNEQVAERSVENSQLEKRTNGSSVDIYEIGTGIYTQHSQFGGRAIWGATFGGHIIKYPSADGNGASTAYASRAGGSTYGIATQVKLIAVKVLSDAGSGSTADIISGFNWAIQAAKNSGRPSIMMCNIGGSPNSAVDAVVTNAVNAGNHVVVAAGNSNADASGFSPARVAVAITVGSVDANGNRASYSNYGSVVDVYSYGTSVTVAWIGSPTATKVISGSGLAVAYVAGILANAIDSHGNKSPAALQADLKSHALSKNGLLIAQPW
ncbi:subtilisin-like serine protease [Ceratobasidium sp. 428]|nr:subtilisin-like serine protease [Ceratobasidium sp. 428]